MIKILFGLNAYHEVESKINDNTTAIMPTEYYEPADSVYSVNDFSDPKTNCITIAEFGSSKHTIMVSSLNALFVRKSC